MRKPIPKERLYEVERRFLEGQTTAKIETDLAHEYKLSRRTIRRYLEKVKARLEARFEKTHPIAQRARIESMLLSAYEKAALGSPKFGSDAKAMTLAAARLGDLYGVFAPQQINHNVNAAVVVLPELETSAVATESGTTDKVSGE